MVYLRNLFPEKAFCDSDIAGVKVRLLQQDCEIVAAKDLFCRIEEGLIKAVEMDVLSGVDLIISKTQRGPALEQYSFKFSSKGTLELEAVATTKKEGNTSTTSKDQKKSVQILLRKLLVTTDALGPLDDDCVFNMRLHFKPHVPIDYEPKWFNAGGDEITFQQDGVEPMDWSLGTIEKGRRSFELLFQARPEQIAMEDDEEEDQEHEQDEEEEIESSYKKHKR